MPEETTAQEFTQNPQQKPRAEIEAALTHFSGTDNYYPHFLRQFLYTDGVAYLAEAAQCHWLLDVIGSYQPGIKAGTDTMLHEFQIWRLRADIEKHTGLVECLRDTGPDDVALSQEIEFTDFPLPEISLYLENGVLCLPGER
jgi:hypothetical protein